MRNINNNKVKGDKKNSIIIAVGRVSIIEVKHEGRNPDIERKERRIVLRLKQDNMNERKKKKIEGSLKRI